MASLDANNPLNDPELGRGRGQDGSRTISSMEFSAFAIESDERNTFAITTRGTEVPNVPLRVRLRMKRDCARGVAFLHSKGLMHCDIKSLNFLVNKVSTTAVGLGVTCMRRMLILCGCCAGF